MIDLSKFINDRVDENDILVVKMDIEGAEYDCLEQLISTLQIKKIKYLAVEWHSQYFKNIDEMKFREDGIKKQIKEFAPALLLEEWH
ncbi:FkbM family methyltransferase [Polynucleobacter paneuropaeus]|nr:FkbM family methyltransferase [Polynucleobacter paneuropaeus]